MLKIFYSKQLTKSNPMLYKEIEIAIQELDVLELNGLEVWICKEMMIKILFRTFFFLDLKCF